MIKVLIVDDQSIIREGLKMMVNHMEGMSVIGEAVNGEEAIHHCRLEQPDVILSDIKMPVLNGVEATKRIKKEFPQIKIIILTTFNDDEYIFQALKYGASGYLLKDAGLEKIQEAIQEVFKGGALIQPQVALKLIEKMQQINTSSLEVDLDPRFSQLTDREKDLLRLIGQGKNNDEIAQELFISRGTVKNHISNILTKLTLRDRTQLAIFALKNNLT